MGLFDLLQSWGGKLGILEMAQPQTAQSAAKIQTRTVTLADLVTEIRSGEVRALADEPAELSIPFERIFETAGIDPAAQSWSVDRLRELLTSDPLKNQPKEVAQKRVLEILHREKVSVEEIVKDAMARDRALDSFEVYARKKIEERHAALERKIADIEDGIRKLQAECTELNEKRRADQDRWAQWRKHKKAREEDLAWAISYVVDRPVISITEE